MCESYAVARKLKDKIDLVGILISLHENANFTVCLFHMAVNLLALRTYAIETFSGSFLRYGSAVWSRVIFNAIRAFGPIILFISDVRPITE